MKSLPTRVVLCRMSDLRKRVRIVHQHDAAPTHARPPDGELVAHVLVFVERVYEENIDCRGETGGRQRCRVTAVGAYEVPLRVSGVRLGARGIDVNAPN